MVRGVTRSGLVAAIVLGALASGALVGCNTLLPAVNMKYAGPDPRPAVLGAFGDDPAVTTAADWRDRRAPLLRAAFEREVYGRMPPATAPTVEARTPVTSKALGQAARAEQWTVRVGPESIFHMVLVTPKSPGRHPVIIMENFCGNRAAFDDLPESVASPLTPVMPECEKKWARPIVEAVFGRYANAPPYNDIVAHGYAVALFYAGDVVADVAGEAPGELARFAGDAPEAERPGAIAVWAWLYSRALDVLAADPRIDGTRAVAWGHSRNGKAALFAAALDPRIAGVIAHQSGKGGATLTRSYAGESVKQITGRYPHWFSKAYAGWAGREEEIPVDQHQLIALIAPRPIFLGAARRDRWSDPEGAFRAAEGATPVYRLLGAKGFQQTSMRTKMIDADIAYVFRDGRHGVTTADWRNFLAFMDAHFREPSVAGPTPTR